MTTQFLRLCVLFGVCGLGGAVWAQPAHHDHGQTAPQPVSRPRIFLDKSPRIVWYQLNRLSNERLLLVERAADDAKYIPVWEAILLRPGISNQDKSQAVAALVGLRSSDAVAIVLDAVSRLTGPSRQQDRAARQLTRLLLEQPDEVLAEQREALGAAVASDEFLVQRTALVALLATHQQAFAQRFALDNEEVRIAYLSAIRLLPDPSQRVALRDSVVASLDENLPSQVRRAAVRAIAEVPSQYARSFQLIAPLLEQPELQAAAVRTLSKMPLQDCPLDVAEWSARRLLEKAESTPARERTSDSFLDAMQLADQLLVRLPVTMARPLRQRLREVTVRVIRIHTVEEEMRYDRSYFAVEAGRPVQIVLQNEDLMPHNLVITAPQAMREVAELGSALAPDQGQAGKQYVPASELVLHATPMVQAGKQERLTFNAPREPGEYPYVCTFPRHWMRMYGVMVVVEDLDAWLQDPQEPADPLGSNRSFVNNWKLDELEPELASGLRGRNPEIGARLFAEATCAQCLKIQGHGGAVGPELTDVVQRWKGNQAGILREILDPSYKVDPKYAVQVIVTNDGRVISGVVTQAAKHSVTIVSNPEAPRPEQIQRSDILEIQKTSSSLMPKGLLDRFTKDEIFEILSYLQTAPRSSDKGE